VISQYKKILFLLGAIQFTHIVDFMIMMPLGPGLMREFQISTTQFGVLISAYSIAAAIAGFISGIYADIFDRKKYILTVYLGFIIATFICGISDSFATLLIARIIAGTFGGVVAGSVYSITSDISTDLNRGRAMGMIATAFSIASVGGVPLGLLISTKYSWNTPFIFLSVFSLVVFFFCLFIFPSFTDHISKVKENIFTKYFEVFKNSLHVKCFLFGMSLMFTSFTIIPYIATYLVSNVGITEHELTYMYLLGGFFTIFSSRYLGRLVDKIGPYKVFVALALSSTIPIIALTNLPPMSIWFVLIATVPFMMIVSGRQIPALTLITQVVNPKQRGSFLAVNSALRHISTGAASLIGGLIITSNADGSIDNYNHTGYFGVIMMLISLYLINSIRTHKKT
jgi:DHA1 family inner membrane transport protein